MHVMDMFSLKGKVAVVTGVLWASAHTWRRRSQKRVPTSSSPGRLKATADEYKQGH
jgi:hypothetical protein